VVETRHRIHAAVVRSDGRLVAEAGDPQLVTFWRSGAKPFQAFPLVADDVVGHFGMSVADLAITCASHSSEPAQVQLVRDLLAKIGCSERDLLCGPHPPLSPVVAEDYAARGVRLTAVYSNCSGKHTGMLALARHHGWPVEFYTRLEHPVQQRCLAEVSRWSGVPKDRVGTAVDGCGVVCFALPLLNMAWAYARLSNVEFGMGNAESVDALPFRNPHSVSRIVEAMLRHPELVAGEGRPCTEMMRAHPGRVLVKVGAAGVYCGLLTREEYGVALKVEDGHGPAAVVAMTAILAELGVRPQPETLVSQAIINTRGETVGELRVNGGLMHAKDGGAARGIVYDA
jgi:L-asparaginase II